MGESNHAVVRGVVHKVPDGIVAFITGARVACLDAAVVGRFFGRCVEDLVVAASAPAGAAEGVEESKVMAQLVHKRVALVQVAH